MSVTIQAIIGLFISQVLGETVPQENIATFIEVGGLLFFTIVAWVGRVRQGDVTWWGGRK